MYKKFPSIYIQQFSCNDRGGREVREFVERTHEISTVEILPLIQNM